MNPEFARRVIAHHLRIFGVDDGGIGDSVDAQGRVLLSVNPDANDATGAREFACVGGIAIAALPTAEFCHALEVTPGHIITSAPEKLTFIPEPERPWSRLRTLHDYQVFRDAKAVTVVSNRTNESVWSWLPLGKGGILLLGTNLAGDLIRYRQGDPAKAQSRPTEALWGISGERPNYLFEDQLDAGQPEERYADWWTMALAKFLSGKLDRPLRPMLPNNAPGAVIISGDDDQAQLEKYAEQLALLNRTPITYFLHPLTKHTRKTIQHVLGKPWIDLGIHPDALDTPGQYGDRLAEQVSWYQGVTGNRPLSVRNHGFLNDGYWGHLSAWRSQGIRFSTNLPGLNGQVMNGSLLPARLALGDTLTDHWSLLTAFGDGMVFALGMSDDEAARRIIDFANSIVSCGVAGLIVINLHPQNVAQTRAMHLAAMQLIQAGFLAWTMTDCLNWFTCRDEQRPADRPRSGGPVNWLLRRLQNKP